ncbi:MAG TPA: DUF3127 domain-containing protein [Chitinophagales bacterium]|mgnify:FL=1|jgi:hypothetical protein|nr:DUF3127 domain-containing protein [Chitinophagales bacterium]HQG38023.1 DUF3127 domain-containing protein [Chitinophagales bacterium]
MELIGKVYKVMPVETGEGKNGTWKKQQVIIEVDGGKFPKKVAMVFWSELTNSEAFVEGGDISVEFDLESREFNGKWYTDAKAWRINKSTSGSTSSSAAAYNAPPAAAYTESDIPPAATVEDDLPF